MAASTPAITVRFEGETEPTTLKIKPVGLMAIERRWGGNAFEERPIEAMLFGVWFGMGKPGAGESEQDRFDSWAGTIDELVQDDVPPSPATPSEPSPPSQFEPASTQASSPS